MTENIGIYIDGANIFFSARRFFEDRGYSQMAAKSMAKFDINSLTRWLAKERYVAIRKYFNSIIPTSATITSFYQCMEKRGYGVFLREQKGEHEKKMTKEAGVDVELSIHSMKDAIEFDTMVLVSGDIDYLPLVEMMLSMNKEVEIIGFPDNTSENYKSMKGVRFIDLTEYYLQVEGKTAIPPKIVAMQEAI